MPVFIGVLPCLIQCRVGTDWPGRFCTLLPAITPPPRQTSPSYSTADCPGVTAHWASENISSHFASVALRNSQAASACRYRVLAAIAPAVGAAPATQLQSCALRVVDCNHGWSWPCTTHKVLASRSLRATNQGSCSP